MHLNVSTPDKNNLAWQSVNVLQHQQPQRHVLTLLTISWRIHVQEYRILRMFVLLNKKKERDVEILYAELLFAKMPAYQLGCSGTVCLSAVPLTTRFSLDTMTRQSSVQTRSRFKRKLTGTRKLGRGHEHAPADRKDATGWRFIFKKQRQKLQK